MPHLMKPGETRDAYLQKAIKYLRKHYEVMREAERCHNSHTADEAMRALEKLYPDMGTFGVEGWCDDNGHDGVSYLNTGDIYELTIVFYSRSGRFYLKSWGDAHEAWERKHGVKQ